MHIHKICLQSSCPDTYMLKLFGICMNLRASSTTIFTFEASLDEDQTAQNMQSDLWSAFSSKLDKKEIKF